MNRNIFCLISLATAAMIFGACSEDKFSQVVEIELPTHTPLLSVSAEFSEVDTLLEAYVSISWSTVDKPDKIYVENATVKLYQDGTLFREFSHNMFGGEQYNIANDGFQPGSTYRLEVSAPGFATVFAEQKMPSDVALSNLTYKFEGVLSPDGEKVDELVFEFDDPAGQEDYYAISGFFRQIEYDSFFMDTFIYAYDLYLESFDPLLEPGGNGVLLLSDKSFDGKKTKVRTYFYGGYYSNPNYRMIGQLVHITKEKYQFLRSLELYYNADGNPFAEPVNIQNNIEGGVGLFSLEAVDTMEVKL